ncbi:MAG: TonB-dependent receptor [Woeseiaceae bacterium]|nr:TonB-dependent receptor [Woeseiaceae bacterium]
MNDASDDFNMRIIADYSEIDENCCVAISLVDGLFSQASIPAFPALVPGSDAALLSLGALISSSYPYPQALLDGVFGPAAANIRAIPFEDYVIAQNYLPESINEDRGISVEINKAIGEMVFSSVTAFRRFDTYDRIDGDFTNVDVLERINIGEQQSISQEFRLSGDFGDMGSYFQVGAYFFNQDIDSVTHTNGGQFMEPYVLALQPDVVELINGVNAVSAASNGALPPAASPFPPGFFVTEDMAQEHKSWAVFGQTDLVFSDKVTLTLGARYTDENKTIHGEFTQTAAGPVPDLDAIALNLFYAATMNPLFNPVPLFAVMQPNNGWGGYLFDVLAPRPDLNAELDDDQFTGTVKLSLFATDNTMFYGSYSTGFKAGGTNTDRISPAFDPIFGPETSRSLEVGFKGTWDRIRVGFSYYQTDFDDFQANSFTGTGFNLQNAGQIETHGWELEYQWQPFDNTTIDGYFANSTGKFKTFVGGTCRDEYVFHTGLADPGSGGDIDAEVCDRSGDVIPYNPEDRAFIALTQDFPIGPGKLFFRVEYTYASDLYTDGDLDPFTLQTGSDLVNLRLGMDIDAWNSRVTLWGRNVTDERSYNGSFDQPLGAGRMNSYPIEPATYGITFSRNWD